MPVSEPSSDNRGICSPGSCQWCGCTFRRPSDIMRHCCAAMQEGQQLLECEEALRATDAENDRLAAEVERLREALRRIATDTSDYRAMRLIARGALMDTENE